MVLMLFSSDSNCKLHILLSGDIFNWTALSTVNNCKKKNVFYGYQYISN